MSVRLRIADLLLFSCIFALAAQCLASDESPELNSKIRPYPAVAAPTVCDVRGELSQLVQAFRQSRIDLPRQARVSRSRRFLYQFTLISGDRFMGEVLARDDAVTTIRLQTQQTIRVPTDSISQIANPPGESDVLYDGFELAETEPSPSPSSARRILDQTLAVDGKSSLRIDSPSDGYRIDLDQPISAGRVEFSFLASIKGGTTTAGEWHLVWNHNASEPDSTIVKVGIDRTITISGASISSLQPALRIGPGWHTFLMLLRAGRLELLIDDVLIATVRAPTTPLSSLQFQPSGSSPGNSLWIDELQVRRFFDTSRQPVVSSELSHRDRLLTTSGDELFGRIESLSLSDVEFESLGKLRSIPLNQLISLNWRQSAQVIRQTIVPKAGVVAVVEMQPFVDRPDSLPELWTVTIREIDANRIRLQHSLIGDMTLRWKETLRIRPLFFGQTLLVDARRFHLGNSIRADFHRQLPDSTEVSGEIHLDEVPKSNAFFSLDVAELEAAGPKAPPASPFLPELRRGQLVTEVLVNDQSIGDLNSQVRFKASARNPDRVRLAILPDLLKPGRNTFRVKQHALEKKIKEFDDCEVGNIRLEFEPASD